MKVAAKVVLAMVLVLIAIRVFEGSLTVQRETRRLDAAIKRDAHLLGRMLSTSVRNAWHTDGKKRALALIEEMNVGEHPIHISWATFRGENGLENLLDSESMARLEAGETIPLRQYHDGKGDVQYFFVPVDLPEADGVVQLAETLEDRSRYVRHALIREAVTSGVVVLVSGTAVILLGLVVIGRPLSQLRERITRIGEGDLFDRLRLRSHDELSALADGLNEMCAKLSASRERERAETEKRIAAMEQVRHMDRLTTIGRLASGIAHELGTPLNVISGRAGMISDGTIPLGSEAVLKNAESIRSQADRMTQIIRHLLDFARQRPPKRKEANAVDVVRQAVDLVTCLGYGGRVRVEPQGPPSSHVAEMDVVQIQQVMTNLIENAFQAMPSGGEVVITVKSVRATPPEEADGPSGRFLRIAVQDRGSGIPAEYLPNIFDPFFTTKDVGKGTGLGLSITFGIIREHGGWIGVQSAVGEGSQFAAYIPQHRRTNNDRASAHRRR